MTRDQIEQIISKKIRSCLLTVNNESIMLGTGHGDLLARGIFDSLYEAGVLQKDARYKPPEPG